MAENISEEEQATLATIKANFGGTWNQISCDNVDAFFEAVGLNYFLRKLVQYVTPDMKIVVEGEEIQIYVIVPFKTEQSILRLNKQVEIENSQGKFLATATFKDGKIFVTAIPSPGNSAKGVDTVREINEEGELVVSFKVHDTDVVSTRVFTKAPEIDDE